MAACHHTDRKRQQMFSYSPGLLRGAVSTINHNDEEARLRLAEEMMSSPGFWGRKDAVMIVREAEEARARLALLAEAGALDLMEEALSDDDLRSEAQAWLADFSAGAERALLPGEMADNPALLTITAGAGGEDARDFAAMTLGEVARYAGVRGLTVEVIDETPDGAGLRDATVRVSGPGAFLIMRGEAGKRRLVRKSPFGSGGRQTSFCAVSCLPEVPESALTVPESDLRYETYRDTGPGGQHRNTTDSAVRVTHLPTGISAKSALRSQHENRRAALMTLMARLADHKRSADAAEATALRVGTGDAGFGGHSRTIVLDPYRLVRNEMSGVNSPDVDGYLAGRVADVRASFFSP